MWVATLTELASPRLPPKMPRSWSARATWRPCRYRVGPTEHWALPCPMPLHKTVRAPLPYRQVRLLLTSASKI